MALKLEGRSGSSLKTGMGTSRGEREAPGLPVPLRGSRHLLRLQTRGGEHTTDPTSSPTPAPRAAGP